MKRLANRTLYLAFLSGLFMLTNCKRNTEDVKEKLKIGVILSLSGNGSSTGDFTLKGIQLAVKEQNDAGGLLGKQIELDIQDSKGVGATGLAQVQAMLAGSNKPFMVCTNTSDVSLNVKTETEKNKVLLLASAATDKLLENSKYILRNYIESDQISAGILSYVADTLHLAKAGVFYANSEFGNSVSTKLAAKAAAHNVALPFNVAYDPAGTDFAGIIAGQAVKNVPAIYVIGIGKSLGIFIKQLRDAGYTGIILGDPLFNNPDTRAAAGTAATGVKYLDFAFNKDANNVVTKSFTARYASTFKTDPQNLSAITYDAVKIVFNAIRETKSFNYDEIIAHAENRHYNGVTGDIWLNGGNINYPVVFRTE